MNTNWKKLFRNHLIDTKNVANFTTVFDINKYNSLKSITETTNEFGPREYLQAWELQGDEKYNGINSPREDIIYTFSDTLIWITRIHAINSPGLDWKDCQLWYFIVIDNGELYESGVLSPLEKNNKVMNYNLFYLELGDNGKILKIKNQVIYWMGKKFNLKISTKYQRYKESSSDNVELLNFYKVSQPLIGGMYQHFFWKYNPSFIRNILYILAIINNGCIYNKLLNIVELNNGKIIVANIRNENPKIPKLKDGTSWKSGNLNIHHIKKDNKNWSWVILQDPKSICINNLFPPFETPPKELFTQIKVDIIPLTIISSLFILLGILLSIFCIYPLIT